MATKAKPYPATVLSLMAEKSLVLSKANAFTEMGMSPIAEPLWAAAAAFEERLAPLLETLGRDREAAVHRISSASCYQKAGDWSRATNLYRAALAGPLLEHSRRKVEQMLAKCLNELDRSMNGSAKPRPATKVSKKVKIV